MRLLQAKSQVTPWGIQRVKGPIKPNPNPNGRIFIVDTGIAQVSDLNIDVSLSENFVWGNNSPSWNDGQGHGTHVSGIVATIDNSINVVGVVPGASVVAIHVFDNGGAGIDYVGKVGKSGDEANLSFGGPFSSAMNKAVTNAAAKGIKFAIAAGNSAKDFKDNSPASASGANVYTVSHVMTVPTHFVLIVITVVLLIILAQVYLWSPLVILEELL
jgi:subtilisin family serine protease